MKHLDGMGRFRKFSRKSSCFQFSTIFYVQFLCLISFFSLKIILDREGILNDLNIFDDIDCILVEVACLSIRLQSLRFVWLITLLSLRLGMQDFLTCPDLLVRQGDALE